MNLLQRDPETWFFYSQMARQTDKHSKQPFKQTEQVRRQTEHSRQSVEQIASDFTNPIEFDIYNQLIKDIVPFVQPVSISTVSKKKSFYLDCRGG